jgi:sterol desaturase/sphingolipid hydroxylase (fatty acid hydroxylase superfamily)
LTAVVLHDTYFYWTHRLMHHRRIFTYVHAVHHQSHNPTPWAAYAFHPLEALVEVGVLPLMVFILPLHPLALSAFGVYMIVMNVMGHLGYEVYPQAFMRSRVLRVVFNTSTHHNMHHRYNKGNYGLYFNLWDRLMKTNHSKYETTFLSITQKTNVHEQDQPHHHSHAGPVPDGLGSV